MGISLLVLCGTLFFVARTQARSMPPCGHAPGRRAREAVKLRRCEYHVAYLLCNKSEMSGESS